MAAASPRRQAGPAIFKISRAYGPTSVLANRAELWFGANCADGR